MPSTAAWSAAILSPTPDEAGGGERRRLGDAHELERQVAVGALGVEARTAKLGRHSVAGRLALDLGLGLAHERRR